MPRFSTRSTLGVSKSLTASAVWELRRRVLGALLSAYLASAGAPSVGDGPLLTVRPV